MEKLKDNDINNTPSNYLCEKSEQWIKDNSELINKAQKDRASFILLLDAIGKYSQSTKEQQQLYERIESIWGNENVFEAIILGNGRIGFQMVERP